MRLLRLGLVLAVLLVGHIPLTSARSAPVQAAVAESGAATTGSGTRILRINVQPAEVKLGRDVTLAVRVTDAANRPVPGAVISATGIGLPIVGTAPRGVLKIEVHAVASGSMLVQAESRGYATARLSVPVVPGPPATVAAIKVGMLVQPPRAQSLPGRVGTDLLDRYHAITDAGQFASLALRDGSLVDLNGNTDVVIKDPLHLTLSRGELFLELVHGAVSHQIQAGTAVAATRGTRLDVRLDPKTNAAVVTVIEGEVQVTSNGKSVLVGTGEQSVVLASGVPQQPQAVSLGGVVSWVNNVPNSAPTTVPPVLNLPLPPPAHPVLNLPQPPPAQIALPPVGATATMTATNPVQARWSGVVYVPSSVTVPTSATLTIAPGTVIKMSIGTSLGVNGTLLAEGNAASPIIFTSAAEVPRPGDWHAISIAGAAASGSVLEYVQAFYGSGRGGEAGILSVTGGASPTIGQSVFSQAQSDGVWVDDSSRPTISDCVFGADAVFAVSVSAEEAGFVTGTELGAAQNGIEIRDTVVGHSTVWQQQDAPYVLDGATVDDGAALMIAPGTVIRMATAASLHIQGTLRAASSSSAPIIITSQSAQPEAGNWDDIVLDGAGASSSVLENVDVYYGGASGASGGMLSVIDGATPTVSHTVFAHGRSGGIWADDASRPAISNCVFADDAGSAISVPADGAAQVAGSVLGENQIGIEVRSTDITHDGTWHAQDAPFVLDGGTLNSGVTLKIDRGTVIRMASGATFSVAGTLVAQGSEATPIILTSDEDDPAPGDWKAIDFVGTGTNESILNHVWLSYGSHGSGDGMLSAIAGAAPAISNSVFAQAKSVAIWADDHSRPTISNCAFAGGGAVAISVPVDGMRFVTGTSAGPNQQGIEVRDTPMRHDATWRFQHAPLIVDGALVSADVTLSIEPGVELRMARGATFHVEGGLRALGSADAPIVVTSNSSRPAAGDWQNIILDGASGGKSILSHVQVSFGGFGGAGEGVLSVVRGANPTITDSVFAQSQGDGIWADDTSRPSIASCSFSSLTGPAISIPITDSANLLGNIVAASQQGVEIRSS